jgi:hypothetical protein
MSPICGDINWRSGDNRGFHRAEIDATGAAELSPSSDEAC